MTDFQQFCGACGWCCKNENIFLETEILKEMFSQSVSQSEFCIFYKDNKCSIYSSRPLECRLFPLDLQEIDGKIWWVLWQFCRADKLCNEKTIEDFEKTISIEYIKSYIKHHKKHQPIKYNEIVYTKIKPLIFQ